jgi:hypothetical protein
MFKVCIVALLGVVLVAANAFSAPTEAEEIYLSEIQFVRPDNAHPRVELINTSDEPVDISGWVLGDSEERGYTFPSGTVVEPEGIVVVSFGGNEKDGDAVPENCIYLYCQSDYGRVAFRSKDFGECFLISPSDDKTGKK